MHHCCHKGDTDRVLELFFAVTRMPIMALTPGGRNSCPVCQEATLNLDCLDQGEIATKQGVFHVLPICPCRNRAGVFILGPYTREERPPAVWCHLTSLLRTLQKQCGADKECRPHCLPVKRAQIIVQKHYDKDISLENIAERLCLNPSYLSTLFKEETGQAFTNFVQQVRVQKSKELLIQSEDSILDIAISVGFTSQNYYTRTFKKLTGLTPSEFRKQAI